MRSFYRLCAKVHNFQIERTQKMALDTRIGPRPRTTPSNPHTQLDQQPEDLDIRTALAEMVFSLPDVEERSTRLSVPGARALWLRDSVAAGPSEAFMIEREFAHLHPGKD